jgi:hypothetical protein
MLHREAQKSDHAFGAAKEAMRQNLFQLLSDRGIHQGRLGGLRHLYQTLSAFFGAEGNG